jgi:hypothetical protein
MVYELVGLIKLCFFASNLNHKQIFLLVIKCHKNYTIYVFQNFSEVFQKLKLQIFSSYKHKGWEMNII